MSAQHAPGRLRLFDTYIDPEIRDDNDKLVAVVLAEKAKSARRLVAAWNACEDITTGELEEIAATGGMLGPREDVAQIAKQRDELLEALKEAATSLETISILSGKKTFGQPPLETYMDDFMQVRGYANSRMAVARAAIAKAEGGAA